MVEFLRFTVFCITLLMLCAMALRFITDMKNKNDKKKDEE